MNTSPVSTPLATVGSRYDVIVVGARLAGAASAMLMARAGLSVLLVDRAGRGTDTLSTHALTPPGVLQLSRWGLLDEIRRAGTPRMSGVAYHYDRRVVEVPLTARGDVDGLYAPRRTVLDRVLVDAAAAAGAVVRHRTRVTDVLVEGGRVAGVTLERGGESREVRASLVIGADGARSSVARSVGALVDWEAASGSACIYAMVPGLPQDVFRNYVTPRACAGVIPTNDGEANVWVTVPMERFDPAGDIRGLWLRELAELDPALADHVAGQGRLRMHGFPGRRAFTRQAWGPGWALVGDAVYFKDPLSAHGMTDALIGAELVAQAAVDIVSGEDESAALGAYAETRAALTAPMRDAVATLATYDWSVDEAQQLHLEMNRAMRGEWQHLMSLPQLGSLPAAS